MNSTLLQWTKDQLNTLVISSCFVGVNGLGFIVSFVGGHGWLAIGQFVLGVGFSISTYYQVQKINTKMKTFVNRP